MPLQDGVPGAESVQIWFLRVEEWQPDEIHRLMCAVCGEHACQIQQ